MNPETKIAIAFLALLTFGLVLLAIGLGFTGKPAAVGLGLALVWSATSVLAALLRGSR